MYFCAKKMYRQIVEDLKKWKENKRRKPLLVHGARQVGKSYVIENFGLTHYKNFVKINFEFQADVHQIFENSLDPDIIIEKLSLLVDEKITTDNTLIFFDEIQACPRAITSLKYFYEKAPQYHIIAAGSLLGVSVSNDKSSYPVGKVNFLHLYPMSFYEFLLAHGHKKLAITIQKSPSAIDESLHNKLIDLMKIFIYVGGMPEAVASYITNKNMKEVKEIHIEIIQAYENDFTKYAGPNQAIKNREIWHSIPYQLGRVSKKFKYSDVKSKARASNYELAIEWLKSAGLIHVVSQIRTAKLPLKGYEDIEKFKLYPLDTGLLCTLLQIQPSTIIAGHDLFTNYNGALTECFVCNEITKNFKTTPHYWISNSEAEVDFVFQIGETIYPLEVKSGLDRNTKSIRSYQKINQAAVIYRASPRKYATSDDGFVNMGLYGVMGIENMN
jgi:uncharacterized protein